MRSNVSVIAKRLGGRVAGLVTVAIALAAFALPAAAGGNQKTISLSVSPTALTTTTTVVYATITNTGNSTANSFEVDWKTSPNFVVTGASAGGAAGSCSTAGRRGAGYSGCVFTKQLPVRTSITITLTVQVTNPCAPVSIDWYAYAWTGAPGPVSQSFQLNCSNPVTKISAATCSVNFVTSPKDAFVDSTITGTALNSTGAPVTVQLVPASSGTAVSVVASPAACATGTSPLTTDASGVAQIAFKGAAAGACTLTVSAAGYGSVVSQQFAVVQQAGDLDCPGGANAFGTTGTNGLSLNGSRLDNVSDQGAAPPTCVVVPYIVSTTCPTGVTGTCTNFVYDPLNQGTHMGFAFHWKWPLEPIPPNGGVDAIAPTLQFFINGNPVGVDLDLCPEIVPQYDSNGNLTGIDPTKPPFDQDSSVPGTQAGCLITRTIQQVGDKVQVIEDAYVQGDYAARRN